MHELSVTGMMLDSVLQVAEKNGIGRVRKITLVIGDLTGYSGESVREYFRDISKKTPAEGAKLEIRRVSLVISCGNCGNTHDVEVPLPHVCPDCGSENIRASGGMQWYIASVEGDPYEKNYG